jgi:sulfur carrier protein
MPQQNLRLFMITLHINGKPRDFEQANMTVANLVQTLGLEGKRLAIECNGEIVPKGSFADTMLSSNDKLEIVGAVGGG